MPKLQVYSFFTFFDPRLSVRSTRKATRATIDRLNGVALEETAEEVEAEQVDERGFVKESDSEPL